MATVEAEMATMAVDPAQGSCPVTDTRGAAVAAAAGQGASTAAVVSTAGRTTAAAGTAEPPLVAEGF